MIWLNWWNLCFCRDLPLPTIFSKALYTFTASFSSHLTFIAPNKPTSHFYPRNMTKLLHFHCCFCVQCFTKADSVDPRSGCTFCAGWSWSTLTAKVTIVMKGALKVNIYLLKLEPFTQCTLYTSYHKVVFLTVWGLLKHQTSNILKQLVDIDVHLI